MGIIRDQPLVIALYEHVSEANFFASFFLLGQIDELLADHQVYRDIDSQESVTLAMYARWLYTKFIHEQEETMSNSSWADGEDIFDGLPEVSETLREIVNDLNANLRSSHGSFNFIQDI